MEFSNQEKYVVFYLWIKCSDLTWHVLHLGRRTWQFDPKRAQSCDHCKPRHVPTLRRWVKGFFYRRTCRSPRGRPRVWSPSSILTRVEARPPLQQLAAMASANAPNTMKRLSRWVLGFGSLFMIWDCARVWEFGCVGVMDLWIAVWIAVRLLWVVVLSPPHGFLFLFRIVSGWFGGLSRFRRLGFHRNFSCLCCWWWSLLRWFYVWSHGLVFALIFVYWGILILVFCNT